MLRILFENRGAESLTFRMHAGTRRALTPGDKPSLEVLSVDYGRAGQQVPGDPEREEKNSARETFRKGIPFVSFPIYLKYVSLVFLSSSPCFPPEPWPDSSRRRGCCVLHQIVHRIFKSRHHLFSRSETANHVSTIKFVCQFSVGISTWSITRNFTGPVEGTIFNPS